MAKERPGKREIQRSSMCVMRYGRRETAKRKPERRSNARNKEGALSRSNPWCFKKEVKG